MKTNRVTRVAAASALVLALALTAAACDDSSSSPKVNAQDQGNSDNNSLATHFQGVKNPYLSQDPSDPLEQKNLAKRLQQFNSKGSTGYVYLLAPNTSQVIGYYVISGKVSSTGSQLTATQGVHNCSGGGTSGSSCSVTETMGDDGTYGPSEGGPNGVFFFTSTGTLIETVMPWVYSSQPIKLYASAPQLDAR